MTISSLTRSCQLNVGDQQCHRIVALAFVFSTIQDGEMKVRENLTASCQWKNASRATRRHLLPAVWEPLGALAAPYAQECPLCQGFGEGAAPELVVVFRRLRYQRARAPRPGWKK